MFEKLFKRPSTVARHQDAPYAEERRRYLVHCAENGYTRKTLLFIARELLWVARRLSAYPDLRLTREQLLAVAQGPWLDRQREWGQKLNRHWTKIRFMQVSQSWLRFLGCLQKPVEPIPFPELVEDFGRWMKEERGLSSITITLYCSQVSKFLRWDGCPHHSLSSLRINDVDAFLAYCGSKGWSRSTINSMAGSLRSFLRHCASNGHCSPSLAGAVSAPRLYRHEGLPTGPSWHDVQRLLASLETDHFRDIRDRAILMLFAVYALRASEVSQLCMEHIDWQHDLIHIHRTKQRGTQHYPLCTTVGNAIARYLREVRPPSPHRRLFLTLLPPFRPISRGGLYGLTSCHMRALEVQSTHRGPHSLRHACAAHLLSEGFSLKEIGDHLGHRSTSATQIYAKVDLAGLREVAAFDLGDVL